MSWPGALQQDAHFEVFLGNFVTGSKSSQNSVPAKFSGLNRTIVHTLSPAVIRFSLISDGPHQDHLHLERAIARTGEGGLLGTTGDPEPSSVVLWEASPIQGPLALLTVIRGVRFTDIAFYGTEQLYLHGFHCSPPRVCEAGGSLGSRKLF